MHNTTGSHRACFPPPNQTVARRVSGSSPLVNDRLAPPGASLSRATQRATTSALQLGCATQGAHCSVIPHSPRVGGRRDSLAPWTGGEQRLLRVRAGPVGLRAGTGSPEEPTFH